MNHVSWSRPYFVVVLLAIVLVPGGAYVAAMTTQSTIYVMTEMNGGMKPALPVSTEFFVQLGFAGIAAVGGTSLLGIICLATKRDHALGTIVSAVLLATVMAFFLAAALASHVPFWCTMWRLS